MVKYRPPAIPEDTPLDIECKKLSRHVTDELSLFIDERGCWSPRGQDDYIRLIRDSLYMYVHQDGDDYIKYDFSVSVENSVTFTMTIEVFHDNYVASRIISIKTELENFDYSPKKDAEEKEDTIKLKSKLNRFYNAATLSEICSASVQEYIRSRDVRDTVEYNEFTMQQYLEEMINVNGGQRFSALIYSIWGQQISFSLRLYDIDKVEKISSKVSKKFFNKATKKFKLVDAVYKRLLRINNAVLAFYIADDRYSIYADFATGTRSTHLNEYLKLDVHHEYVDSTKYKAEMIWIPYIFPYIRFNLIEALELMGSSYYDHDYTDPEREYDNWLVPLREMFDDVVYHYEKILNYMKYRQITPLSYDMIRQFLDTDYSLQSVQSDTTHMLQGLYRTFYKHNEIESILVLDYAMGIYQSIGYVMTNTSLADYHKGAMLSNLYDMVTSVEECITRYNDIDKYMLNDILTVTWSYELIFISKYSSTVTDEYLRPSLSFFGKRKSKNPYELYKKPVNFRNEIFSDFEYWIGNKIMLGKDV